MEATGCRDRRNELFTELRALPAIDCHEHLRFGHMGDWRRAQETTFPYVGSLSAILQAPYLHGFLADHLRGETFWRPRRLESRNERQAIITALSDIARTQPSVYRANLVIPFRDLYDYDITQLRLNDWNLLEQRIRQQYEQGPWQRLARLAEQLSVRRIIKVSVTPGYYQVWLETLSTEDRRIEQELFACTINVDSFIRHRPRTGSEMDESFERLAENCNGCLDTFNDYREVVTRTFDAFRQTPAVGFKTGMAGYRRFDDPVVPLTRGPSLYELPKIDATQMRDWQSLMFGIVAQEAGRVGLPLGIHAGFDGKGRSPVGLEPIIADNPRTDFVIIHAGYPHHLDTANLAVRYPNLHVDLTWIPVMDFSGAVDAYEHLLRVVPSDRLSIGADAHYPETFYGMWIVHLEALAAALMRLIDRHGWSRTQAVSLAQRLLNQNPVQLYGLD